MPEQAKSEYEKIANQLKVKQSNMFGKPVLKHEKKAFAALDEDAMVFRTGRDTNKDLLEKYEGSELWDPSGKERPMKDWIKLPAAYIEEWLPLAKQAQMHLDQEL